MKNRNQNDQKPGEKIERPSSKQDTVKPDRTHGMPPSEPPALIQRPKPRPKDK